MSQIYYSRKIEAALLENMIDGLPFNEIRAQQPADK